MTATSDPGRGARSALRASAGLLAAGAIAAAAGCGGTAIHRTAAGGSAFGWLRPATPPAGWHTAALPSGAVLAYPPGWRPVRTDAGTASVAMLSPDGEVLGYLNATPRQGDETLANWATFRPSHDRGEGNRSVRLLGHATGLSFMGGRRGSCVDDRYVTSTGARYREIACLVTSGRGGGAVIIAAAPPAQWPRMSADLRRAVRAFRA